MSGKPAARLWDMCSPHPCHFTPTPAISGCVTVLINNLPAVRVGDQYIPHACPSCAPVPHPVVLATGSPTVLIGGMPAGRIGDKTACGSTHAAGSPDVLIGDSPSGGGTRGAFG